MQETSNTDSGILQAWLGSTHGEAKMIVELISVGTEILLGNIVNTNAAYLSEQCAGLGLSCYYQDVVGDNEDRLCETIRIALGRADILDRKSTRLNSSHP